MQDFACPTNVSIQLIVYQCARYTRHVDPNAATTMHYAH